MKRMLLKENENFFLYVSEGFRDYYLVDENFIEGDVVIEIVSKKKEKNMLRYEIVGTIVLELSLDGITKAYKNKGLVPPKAIKKFFSSVENANAILRIEGPKEACVFFETIEEMDSYLYGYDFYSFASLVGDFYEDKQIYNSVTVNSTFGEILEMFDNDDDEGFFKNIFDNYKTIDN